MSNIVHTFRSTHSNKVLLVNLKITTYVLVKLYPQLYADVRAGRIPSTALGVIILY